MPSRITLIYLSLILGSLFTLGYLSFGSNPWATAMCLVLPLVGLGGLWVRYSDKLEALQEIIKEKDAQMDTLRRAFKFAKPEKVVRAEAIIYTLAACPSRRIEWLLEILPDLSRQTALEAIQSVMTRVDRSITQRQLECATQLLQDKDDSKIVELRGVRLRLTELLQLIDS